MKICVGLSGGVDSSVAALLLKRQGYDVFAMFMQNWHDTEGTLHGDCSWEEDRFVAELVARKLGIPFYFIDLSGPYRERVVNYMFDEYARGRTPNPDVLCNSEIKFDAFLDAARRLGADKVATGHYCRKEEIPGSGECRFLEGVDPGKDQSYFLCRLTQEQLSAALFPIGELCKSEVRALAAEAGLPSADRKDSQGICFVGKVDLPVFLQQKLRSVEGEVVEIFDSWYDSSPAYALKQELLSLSEDLSEEQLCLLAQPYDYSGAKLGKGGDACIAGKHEGAQFYTLGQRKGLRIGGHAQPLFVIATDIERNRIYVGEGASHRGLFSSCIRIAPEDIHWMRPELGMKAGQRLRVRVRVRYRQELQDAVLLMKDSALFILFDEPQRSVTPGQFAVWYAADGEDAPELLGSGII